MTPTKRRLARSVGVAVCLLLCGSLAACGQDVTLLNGVVSVEGGDGLGDAPVLDTQAADTPTPVVDTGQSDGGPEATGEDSESHPDSAAVPGDASGPPDAWFDAAVPEDSTDSNGSPDVPVVDAGATPDVGVDAADVDVFDAAPIADVLDGLDAADAGGGPPDGLPLDAGLADAGGAADDGADANDGTSDATAETVVTVPLPCDATASCSATGCPPPIVLFDKPFPLPIPKPLDVWKPTALASTPDGYVVASYHAQLSYQEVYVSKTDALGNVLWHAFVTGDNNAAIHRIVPTGTGFVVVGQGTSGGALAARLDAKGQPLWKVQPPGIQWFNDVAVDAQGFTAVGGSGIWWLQALVTRFDLQGKVAWTKTIEDAGDGVAILPVAGGHVVLTSYSLRTFTNGGDLVGSVHYGGGSYALLKRIAPLADGYLLFGWAFSKSPWTEPAWVVRTDLAGKALWQRTYAEADFPNLATGLAVDGAGVTLAGPKGLVRSDLAGNVQWQGGPVLVAAAPTLHGFIGIVDAKPNGWRLVRTDAFAATDCGTSGKCYGLPASACDDGLICTLDGCDAASGCAHLPASVTVACDDGEPCTLPDHCTTVLGAAACQGPSPAGCDDHDACTADACVAKSCQHAALPSGSVCSDGNACTGGETCSIVNGKGACADGVQVDCSDGNPCTDDRCNAQVGCVAKDPTCNDFNPCTADKCTALGCAHLLAPAQCPKLKPGPQVFSFCKAVALPLATSPPLKGPGGVTQATWAIDASPIPTGSGSNGCTLNFNDGTGYLGEHWGTALFTGLFPPSVIQEPAIEFRSYFDGNPSNQADVRMVEASTDGFETVPVAVQLDNAVQGWTKVKVDLAKLKGKSFQVRFRFETKGINQVASRKGWFIDDLVVH